MTKDASGNGPNDNVGGNTPSTEQFASGYAFAITKSDTADLERIPRGIYVGGAGNVTVENLDGSSVTFVAPPVGSILPVQVRKVLDATTATNLVGLS